jgi:hypothetical protein
LFKKQPERDFPMNNITKMLMVLVMVFAIISSNRLLMAQAGTINMAEKIKPVCKKYGYEAIKIWDDSTKATCVDKDGNSILNLVDIQMVETNPKYDGVALAIDIMIYIGAKDTKANLLNAVAKAKKQKGQPLVTKNYTNVTYLNNGSISFYQYNSYKAPIIDKYKLNAIAKKIEPTCKKYDLIAISLSETMGACVNKKKISETLIRVDGKEKYASAEVFSYSKKYEIVAEIAYILGKKDTKAEMLRVIKLALKKPHITVKTKNGVPISADRGGRVYISYTKTNKK